MARLAGVACMAVAILLFVFGVAGDSTMCMIGLIPAIVGALLFAAAQNADKRALEERRHQETIEALKRDK